MRLFRFLQPLSRDACRETGVLPPRPSRERELLSSSARPRVEWLDESFADAALRRREKYAAAVVLAAAVSAARTGTVWAGGLTGHAARGETL